MPISVMKRVFTAIEIPKAAKNAVGAHISGLRREFPDSPAKWVHPEKLHLTLRFIGNATDETIANLISAQSAVASCAGRFTIELSGTGVFPRTKSAKVLWIGTDERPDIADIKSELDEELESYGIEKELRKYRPHLTIARLSTIRGCEDLVERHLEKGFGPVRFEVDRIVLFESTLQPEGPSYSVLHTATFGG